MDSHRPPFRSPFRGRLVRGGVVLTIALASLLAAWPAGGTPNEPGPKPNPAIPAPPTTNAAQAQAPGPTKNDTAQPAAARDTVALAPASGPKARPGSAKTGVSAAQVFPMQTCGSASDGGVTITSTPYTVIRSCTLSVAEPGVAFISASSSLGIAPGGGNYEVRLNVNVDSTSGNSATDRWVNVYTDSADGTDKSTATSLLVPLTAGDHTFYYLGARYSGTGTVQLYDPSLSVLFFPSSLPDVQTCGVAGNTTFNTTETSFQAVRSCSLTVPGPGFVFLSANATAALGAGGASEARVRVGVDTVSGTASSDRWINVAPDGGDGTDEALATSLLTSVSAGTHTFYFSATRYSGAGAVQLYDPTLSVLYFATPNTTAQVCGAGGSDSWTNATNSYTTIRSCALNVPEAAGVYMDAGGSAGLNAVGAGNEWEGQFRLGIDNDIGSSTTDRWVNMYQDPAPGDGTDRPVAATFLGNVAAGPHTFSFVGRRYSGTGTLRLYSPSLTVIVPLAEPPPTPTPTQTPTATATVTATVTATAIATATPTTVPLANPPVSPTPSAPGKIMLPFMQR